MNLRNGQITVRELLQHPRARALLTREFPMLARNPFMLAQAGGMTLNAVMGYGRRYVSPQKLQWIMQQLKAYP